MRKAIAYLIIFWIAVLSTCTVFAQETKSQLTTRFNVIRNETAVGGNTKTRIANAYQELSDGTIGVYPVVASGTNTYSGTLVGIDSYSGNPIVFVVFPNNNTGASTFNLNAISANSISKDSVGNWVALEADDIKAGKLYRLYNDGTRWQIDLGGSGSGGITGTGTADQIGVWNGTNSQTGYSNFTWDNTNKRFIVGNGTSSGSNSINFGDDTDLYGSWAFTTAESSTIRGNNNISAGWLHEIGDGVTFGSGASTFTWGVEHENHGNASHVGGIGGKVEANFGRVGGFVQAFNVGSVDGTKPDDVEFLLATDGAFNIGRNTSAQTSGRGAMAVDGGILGGVDNHIPDTSPRSIIIGGQGIEARASDPDNVYVPNLNIMEATQDDTLSHILAQDMTSKKVYWRDVSTIIPTIHLLESVSVSTSGGTITLDYDLGNYDDAVQKIFIGSNTFSSSKTLAFSNTSNALVFNFHFEVTNVAGTLICSTCVMSSTDWDSGSTTWTPPDIGEYEMGGTWDGTSWKVKIIGPYN